jgi:alkylhydroperoxidase/carboxymuconolactone decarboxylase family protein YurZ
MAIVFDMVSNWDGEAPFSAEETQDLLTWYAEHHGEGSLDLVKFAPWLIQEDSRTMKQYLRFCRAFGQQDHLPYAVLQLQCLHFYIVTRNDRGVFYEIIAARRSGASKAQVMDTIRYAFVESGPPGMNSVVELSQKYLNDWPDDEAGTVRWPDGWVSGDERFRMSLDPETDNLTADEVTRIREWYAQLGDTNAEHVEMLARVSPTTYKAYLMRYERPFSRSLPVQLLPLLTLFVAAALVRPDAVRRSAIAAHALGVRRNHIVATLWWGFLYCGQTGVETGIQAVADLLGQWSE